MFSVSKSCLLIQHTVECFISNKRFGTGHSKMTETKSLPRRMLEVTWGRNRRLSEHCVMMQANAGWAEG